MKSHLLLFGSLLSSLFVMSLTASAQTSSNYRLYDYKVPELRYRKLETGLYLGGFNTSGKNGSLKSLNRNFEGDVTATYSTYLNSAKIQRSQYVGVSFNTRTSYNKYDTIRFDDLSGNNAEIQYWLYNKRYFPNKLFIGTDLHLSYRYGHSMHSSEDKIDTLFNNYDHKENRHNFETGIPLKFGYGRIEQVQDYQEAIYIYEDLVKSGRAQAGKSDEEIMELAAMISQLKSRRYFDIRIKNIDDIEALDSFLIVNNYKTVSDARFYATLVDNWNFVNHFTRLSGTTLAIAFMPYFTYRKEVVLDNFTNVKTPVENRFYEVLGGITFEHYKPLNLYWQTNTELTALGGYSETWFNDSDTIFDPDTWGNSKIELTFDQSVSYYPNTRKQVTASLYAQYSKYIDNVDDSESLYGQSREIYASRLALDANYYISPKLRLNANASMTYRYSTTPHINNKPVKTFYTGFTASLMYSVF